jgi:hypothetical protein
MRQGWSPTSTLRSVVLTLLFLSWFQIGLAQEIQLPLSRRGTRTAPILLLSRSDIQRELALSPEFVAQAKTFAGALQRKAAALRGQTGAGLLVARRAIDDEQARWLNQNLSQPQLERLHQLDLQWEGPAALASRPIIAEAMDLTPEQRTSVAKIIADHLNHPTGDSSRRDLEAALSRKVFEILSPRQRERWSALQGTPFQFEAEIASTPNDRGRDGQTSRR